MTEQLITLTEFINIDESIDIINGKLVFGSTPNKETGISTSFGKTKNLTPFTKTIKGTDGVVSYSLYQAKNKNSSDIMKAVKSTDFSNDDIHKFLKRSSIYAARVLRPLDIDLIVTPVSSSPLTKEFAKYIQKRTNYDVLVDSFKKRPDLSRVEIDVDHPKITPKIIKSMQSILKRAIKQGNLTIKMFAPMHRMFVKNLFEVTEQKILTKTEGQNIIIIDDVTTSGTTIKNINDILVTNKAKSVNALTIFKSSK